MVRRLTVLVGAALVMAASSLAVTAMPAGATTPVSLNLDQGTAFSYLGHSCGGIQEKSFAQGFDASSGFPIGDVYLSTRCGGSGRDGGGTSTLYTTWVGVTWDYDGAIVATTAATAPSVNPTLTAYDAYGNEIYNQSNAAYILLASTFVPTPTVISLSVAQGPSSGGTSVTIRGTDFDVATAVSFGGLAAASFTITNDTTISAVSPPSSPGTFDVTVTSAGGTSAAVPADQFTFVAAPVITGLSPNSGPVNGGTPVTVTGSGFTGATLVLFGGIYAPFTVVDDSTISATSPAGENPDDESVTVTTVGGTSASTSASRFTYTAYVPPPVPTVTAVSPAFGPTTGGTAITITGTGFTGATDVAFGATSVSGFTVISDTSITTTSPAGTGSVDVTVTNAYGTSAPVAADLFSYGPLVTGIAPAAGSAGGHTTVMITGVNFLHAKSVHFGGTLAVKFTVNTTGTAIAAVSPPEVGTGVESEDVTVTTPTGTSPTSSADLFTYEPPLVTKAAPAQGSAGGDTKVTISGSRFVGATSVTFGLVPAVSFAVNATGTAITAYTPQQPGTGVEPVDVTVTTAAGPGTLASGFTYAAPVISMLSPTSGSGAGGTTVTIMGSYLFGATSVTFGGASATITSATPTRLTVVTPPGEGKVSVSVSTTAGTATRSSAFTYVVPGVTAISPNTGTASGGTSVTITGTRFTGATGVSFGSTPATSFTVDSPTSIVAVAPAGTGVVDVRVSNAAGASPVVATDRFTYT